MISQSGQRVLYLNYWVKLNFFYNWH